MPKTALNIFGLIVSEINADKYLIDYLLLSL